MERKLMKIRTVCLLLGALLLAGCWQKSLHPFYQPQDLVFDDGLLGTWREGEEPKAGDEDTGNVWRFARRDAGGYELELADGDQTNRYVAQLFELDNVLLLDIVPAERTMSTIPAHNLFKVITTERQLALAALNTDWMQKWLRKNPGRLAHFAVVDTDHPEDRKTDEFVLTADTAALQKFLRAHWGETNLFAEPEPLRFVAGSKKD